MKCPCKQCISFAICISNIEIRCPILYKYLERNTKSNDSHSGITELEGIYNKKVSSCFPVPKNLYYIRWEEKK